MMSVAIYKHPMNWVFRPIKGGLLPKLSMAVVSTLKKTGLNEKSTTESVGIWRIPQMCGVFFEQLNLIRKSAV